MIVSQVRAEALAGRQVLAQGRAHIRSIQLNGRMILGYRDLGLDGIRGLREVTIVVAER